jgi:prevent-host-death family protein
MRSVNVHEAKTSFSKLLARVARGERIVIAKNGVPVAVLGPYEERPVQRELGIDRGRIRIDEDFNAPLSDAVLREFEGS